MECLIVSMNSLLKDLAGKSDCSNNYKKKMIYSILSWIIGTYLYLVVLMSLLVVVGMQ